MPAPATPAELDALARHLASGSTQVAIAKIMGRHPNWVHKHTKAIRGTGQGSDAMHRRAVRLQILESEGLGRPRKPDELCADARRALEDFGFFRQRYMGRASPPWQVQTAKTVEQAIGSSDQDYVVENVAPGFGKSTLLHDIACWCTARDRSIRGLFGSAVFNNAKKQVNQVRRTLERTYLLVPSAHDAKMGAMPATGNLVADYGIFRDPTGQDVWRQDEFVVVQFDGNTLESKELTWSAVGMDTEFLGNRFDLIFWDDLVTSKTIATETAIEDQRRWWNGTAERRLEPRGSLFLVGQRMGADDLYRYALDKVIPPDDDETDMGEEHQYQHIVYRAHDDEKCEGVHKAEAKPWPDGCMLDPTRFTWRDMRNAQADPTSWAIQYQQEDANPIDVLVQKLWVSGGRDPATGEIFTGCWDPDRGAWELPPVPGRRIIYATADTSPTKWWGVHSYAWYPDADLLYLLDLRKDRLTPEAFLDQTLHTGELTGLMVDWQNHSQKLGMGIQYWVIEGGSAANAHWLLNSPRMDAFRRQYKGVRTIEHKTTGINKGSKEYGPYMAKEWWRSGSLRLPGQIRDTVMPLVNEVCRWPNAGTEDQVMAHWFGLYNMPNMKPPIPHVTPQQRPSWVTSLPSVRSA